MSQTQKTASKKSKPTAACSALVCVYEKDNAEHFGLAIKSLYEQTLLPNEVVIVGDGKLSDELYNEIKSLKKHYPNIKYYELEKNSGIGVASNYGISKCKNELIAKMDSDDISLPERIEKQARRQRPQVADVQQHMTVIHGKMRGQDGTAAVDQADQDLFPETELPAFRPLPDQDRQEHIKRCDP